MTKKTGYNTKQSKFGFCWLVVCVVKFNVFSGGPVRSNVTQTCIAQIRCIQVASKDIALFLPMFVIVYAMGFTTPLLVATIYTTKYKNKS